MAEVDWKQRVEARETELTELRARWTTDEDLLNLTPYKMKRLDGQEEPKEKTSIVTLNDPATFKERVQAVLLAAFQQEIVEGKDLTDEETATIEDLLRRAEAEADERLTNRGKWPAYAFEVEQFCMRGRAASRLLVRKKDGNVIIDETPLDTRYVIEGFDAQGLEYQAYKVIKRMSELEAEYPDKNLSATPELAMSDTATLLDLWTRTRNMRWVNDLPVHNALHPYGEVPGVYTFCPAGSMLAGPDAISHHGESIFALDRGLWPEMDDAASVLKTLNKAAFNQGLQMESDAGTEAALPEKDPRTPGAITAVEMGGGFKGMPVADIKNATRHLLAMLEQRIQRGSLPAIDWGNLTFPLSAVAIARLTEGREQVFVPRIQGLALHKRAKARLIIRQLLRIGGTVELGAEGARRTFNTKVLNKSFTVKYRYFSEPPEQKIANYTIGEAASAAGISRLTIFEEILKLPDPHGEMRKRRAEDAERLDPVIGMYRHVHSLIDEGKDLEAKMLRITVLRLIRERGMGQEEQPAPAAPSAAKGAPLVPLLSGGEATGARGPDRGAGDIADDLERAEEKRGQQADIMAAAREVEARG